ncbi:phage replisome organizer N-terminal domain-containing protein [Phascolarctobacterium succinatutens]|uniref:phage replisome organizer N-terminal domain-containing protein n=1 Tax=Phascolarctobacterium succinatutens TaxID=626940 RepID=UPI0026ED2225|nr:phage replisome organizer N-terminal domain-containing protein [Phascolarctobacterium succinatutens]
MADVKWIKIAVDMFDNRKIKQIGSMPEGDSLLLMWVQLLCLAGNVNDGGFIYLTKEIPYTDEMLATQFNKPISTVRLALKTFEQFGMIEIINNMIFLSSWEKYQSTDRLTAIREKDRERKRRKREAEKLLPQNSTEIPRTSMDVPRIDIEGDIDIDKDKNKSISKKSPRHKHGEYQNVLLSDDDLEKLKAEFPSDWDQRIQRLSEYMASSGKSYKNHLATIRNWARRDKPAAKAAGGEDMTDLDKYF